MWNYDEIEHNYAVQIIKQKLSMKLSFLYRQKYLRKSTRDKCVKHIGKGGGAVKFAFLRLGTIRERVFIGNQIWRKFESYILSILDIVKRISIHIRILCI